MDDSRNPSNRCIRTESQRVTWSYSVKSLSLANQDDPVVREDSTVRAAPALGRRPTRQPVATNPIVKAPSSGYASSGRCTFFTARRPIPMLAIVRFVFRGCLSVWGISGMHRLWRSLLNVRMFVVVSPSRRGCSRTPIRPFSVWKSVSRPSC